MRGSYVIVEMIKKLIAENGLENKVELAGAFCLGACNQTGVSVKFGDEVVSGVTAENLESIFAEKVLA